MQNILSISVIKLEVSSRIPFLFDSDESEESSLVSSGSLLSLPVIFPLSLSEMSKSDEGSWQALFLLALKLKWNSYMQKLSLFINITEVIKETHTRTASSSAINNSCYNNRASSVKETVFTSLCLVTSKM